MLFRVFPRLKSHSVQVYDTVRRLKRGQGTHRKYGTGRRASIRDNGREHIQEFLRDNQHASSTEIAATLSKLKPDGGEVASRTVRRFLKKERESGNYQSPKSSSDDQRQWKCLLTVSTKAARVSLATCFQSQQTVPFVFCGEAQFAVDACNRVIVQHPPYDTTGRAEQHIATVNVLGAVSLFGTVGFLSLTEAPWTAADTCKEIASNILPTATAFFGSDWCLLLDSREDWSDEQHDTLDQCGVPSVESLPRCSTDMTPLEDVWSLLQRLLPAHGCQSTRELQAALVAEWEFLPRERIAEFCESMPRRMTDIIKLHGGRTGVTRKI